MPARAAPGRADHAGQLTAPVPLQGAGAAAYAELSALTGAKLPDYRGVFLRGHGTVASAHYGAVTHQSGALGVLQGDAARNVVGRGVLYEVLASGGTGALIAQNISNGVAALHSYGPGGGTALDFDASRVAPTAVENRPVNRAVVYLVRAR